VFSWLNDTAIQVLGEDATWSELIGFVTGLAAVWLVVRQHIANWPVGILNVVALMVAFWTAGLYADAGLQIVYVVLGFYGWWQWHTGRDAVRDLPVRLTTRAEWWWLGSAGLAATALLYLLLSTAMHSTVPAGDAVTTALSLVATYGQCRKLLESWWFWIAADVIYIPLYAYKHLYLTTVLYAVFLGLCVAGLLAWRADRRAQLTGARGQVLVG
jgi:nicotinamide mononucleotide transporter